MKHITHTPRLTHHAAFHPELLFNVLFTFLFARATG